MNIATFKEAGDNSGRIRDRLRCAEGNPSNACRSTAWCVRGAVAQRSHKVLRAATLRVMYLWNAADQTAPKKLGTPDPPGDLVSRFSVTA